MAKRFYPAVLEKGAKGTFGVWFPDFPDCVAAGRSQEEAIEKAEHALAHRRPGVGRARHCRCPNRRRFEAVVLPKGCRFVAILRRGRRTAQSVRAGEHLSAEELARARRCGRGTTRHQPLELFRPRHQHGPRHVARHSGSAAPATDVFEDSHGGKEETGRETHRPLAYFEARDGEGTELRTDRRASLPGILHCPPNVALHSCEKPRADSAVLFDSVKARSAAEARLRFLPCARGRWMARAARRTEGVTWNSRKKSLDSIAKACGKTDARGTPSSAARTPPPQAAEERDVHGRIIPWYSLFLSMGAWARNRGKGQPCKAQMHARGGRVFSIP